MDNKEKIDKLLNKQMRNELTIAKLIFKIFPFNCIITSIIQTTVFFLWSFLLELSLISKKNSVATCLTILVKHFKSAFSSPFYFLPYKLCGVLFTKTITSDSACQLVIWFNKNYETGANVYYK
jgi:hypothetical protein